VEDCHGQSPLLDNLGVNLKEEEKTLSALEEKNKKRFCRKNLFKTSFLLFFIVFVN